MSRDTDPGLSRPLGGLEVFSARCHDHHNLNTMLALTIHTRAALDTGLVQITLQELQHSCPLLTSRIVREGGREVFRPMEVPTLPIDRDIQCQDMLHTRFDTENGPLWRVQIITQSTFEKASKGLAFGPEMEAIIEDDSDLETRWRYYLRYLQGCLNQDIESFENSLGLEEEGRSVVIMTFHPAITDTPGALYWAKQFMTILDQKLESDRPISAAGDQQPVMPRCVESLLPGCEPGWGSMLSSVVSQVSQLLPAPSRPSPLAPLLRPAPDNQGQHSRSHFLRGWLSEEETRELLAQCCEDDISLQGLVLAACLAATARVACPSSPPPSLRASVVTNLRQHLSPAQAPRHGALSAPLEVTWRLDQAVEDREQLWALAHQLTSHLTQAKADRLALRQVRMYAKMTQAATCDSMFPETPDKITSEMSVSVLGDLGNIFRRESSAAPYESWTGQPLQVKLEDVFPMVAGQSLGSALGHSVHVYQGRLQYILTYYTSYADTSTALMIRDETMNVLRMSVM